MQLPLRNYAAHDMTLTNEINRLSKGHLMAFQLTVSFEARKP